MKKEDLNNILAIGNDLLKSNSNNSKIGVYKNELYIELNDREKKSLRIKLRNKLSYFVDTMIEYNKIGNVEKCKSLANSFIQYAGNIYNNINILYENNTQYAKAQKIDDFRKLVEKYTTTKK